MTMSRTLLACGSAVCLLAGSSLGAHEIGTTRVTLDLADASRYEIEIQTDAVALLEKLESMSGISLTSAADTTTLERRLREHEPAFRQRVTVAFDGERNEPAISWRLTPSETVGGTPLATVRLSGAAPGSATHLTWKYGWTFTPYPFTVRRGATAEPVTQWLEGSTASSPVALAAAPIASTRVELAWRYVVLGFTHILPKGLDHVLFVLGLFLLNRRVRPILLQVSAFTVAHSITLALGIYGLVTVPASIVEPLIALSIAYIALENVFTTRLTPWRYTLVFAFGLLHGLGFAGALSEVGLPRTDFLTALVGFNVGVELGQLAVVAGAFLAVGYRFGERTWFRSRVSLPASVCIAVLGIYWTVERLGFAA